MTRVIPPFRPAWGAVPLLALACSGPSGDETFVPIAPPLQSFIPVGDVLETHCGTLDCHGNAARNLRVYGTYGLRLDPAAVSGLGSTTDAEYAATYEAVVAIQPEVLTSIVVARGAGAERWIVITKARGSEVHVGGGRLPLGSDGDRCLLTWLVGPPDPTACQNAAGILPPGGEEW